MNADDIIAQLEQRKNELTINQMARLRNVTTAQASTTQQSQSQGSTVASTASPSAFGQIAQQLSGSPTAPAAPAVPTKSSTGGQITPTATGLVHTAKPTAQSSDGTNLSTIQNPELAARQDAAIAAVRANMIPKTAAAPTAKSADFSAPGTAPQTINAPTATIPSVPKIPGALAPKPAASPAPAATDIAARKAALAQSKADREAGKGITGAIRAGVVGEEFYSNFLGRKL